MFQEHVADNSSSGVLARIMVSPDNPSVIFAFFTSPRGCITNTMALNDDWAGL
jgi:hypothetical protein